MCSEVFVLHTWAHKKLKKPSALAHGHWVTHLPLLPLTSPQLITDKHFCFHLAITSAAVQRAKESKWTGEKRATVYCCWRMPLRTHYGWGPPFPLSASHPWEHCACVLAPHVLSLCHPAENVTPGSKSKLNLILIHLIEEPDPKVEAVFDLLQGMGRKDYGWLSYLGAMERNGAFCLLLSKFFFSHSCPPCFSPQTNEGKEKGVSTIRLPDVCERSQNSETHIVWCLK